MALEEIGGDVPLDVAVGPADAVQIISPFFAATL